MKVLLSRTYFGPNQHSEGSSAYVQIGCSAEELKASADRIAQVWRDFSGVMAAAGQSEVLAAASDDPPQGAAPGDLRALVVAAAEAVGRAVGESLSFKACGGEVDGGGMELIVQGRDAELGRRASLLAVETVAWLLARPAALAALKSFAGERRPSLSEGAILAVAEERKIPVVRLDRWPFVAKDSEVPPEQQGRLLLGQGHYQQRLAGTATAAVLARTEPVLGSRALSAAALRRAGIPVPEGDPEFSNFNNARRAVRSAQRIGYPVVLKPLSSRIGQGVSVDLTSDQAVVAAYEAASRYDQHVIVERHIPGDTYRLLIIGGEVIAACRRRPRSEVESPPSPTAIDFGRLGEAVRATALAAAECFDLQVAGVDVVTPNPGVPLEAVGGAVIRLDPAPDLGLHLLDGERLPLSVARRFITHLFPEGNPTRIPIAAITGTAGKTTTSRMVARILEVGGYQVGLACTDGVYVGRELIARGTFSGISGALRLFSDSRVKVAVLETSRGTLVKRGLGFDHPNVGACTKVEADHIGLDGIESLDDMARLKRVVVERATEMAVLNAEDPLCLAMLPYITAKRTALVSTDPDCPAVLSHIAAGGVAVVLDSSGNVPSISRWEGAHQDLLMPINEIPATWSGAARHNVQNALFATAIAMGLGVGPADIRQGLASFHASDSPKRVNLYDKLPFQVILDQAATVPGYRALCDFTDQLPVEGHRVLVFYGIGDRRDQDLRDIGQRVSRSFDTFICFDPAHYRRGRQDGEIPSLLSSALLEEGVQGQQISVCGEAQEGVKRALSTAAAGDLVVIVVPGSVEDVIGWLDQHQPSRAPECPASPGEDERGPHTKEHPIEKVNS